MPSKGAVAGIVIGSVLGGGALIAAGAVGTVILLRKRRENNGSKVRWAEWSRLRVLTEKGLAGLGPFT